MGAWGTGIFQDDFACDLRDCYNELAALGFDDEEILAQVKQEFGGAEGIDSSTFWIALALLQHKLGRLSPEIRDRACALIDSGQALQDWIELTEENDPSIKTRAKHLQKAKETILSPQPERKSPRPSRDLRERIDRTYERFEWKADHLYAYRTRAGEWLVFVASEVHPQKLRRHYAKKGSRYVRVEAPELLQPYLLLMNYRGVEIPRPATVATIRPYIASVSAEDRRTCLDSVDQIRSMFEKEAAQTFEEFERGNRAHHPGKTDEQFRARYLEYTSYCRDQAARYSDREQSLERNFYKRYMLDPKPPVPMDRLVEIEATPRHIDCEDVCIAANWDTLEGRVRLPGLG